MAPLSATAEIRKTGFGRSLTKSLHIKEGALAASFKLFRGILSQLYSSEFYSRNNIH